MKIVYPTIEFDYSSLIGRIVEKFGNRSRFADALNISRTTLTNKLTNKISFGQLEIKEWCKLLEIPDELVGFYFFTPKVE